MCCTSGWLNEKSMILNRQEQAHFPMGFGDEFSCLCKRYVPSKKIKLSLPPLSL
jgi:hypothetical protein